MFGKFWHWLTGGATPMNEDSQVHDHSTAAGVATDAAAEAATAQAGIVAVDGAATTGEGPAVSEAAATAGATAQAEPQGGAAAMADPQAEAAAQLAAIYKSLPGVVPALIGGATVAAVQQSLEASKQQFA